MIPIRDDNPTFRTPVVTIGLLCALAIVWVLGQGSGFDAMTLAASVCNWGLVPGEITGMARVGAAVPMGEGLACVVDDEPRNLLTPLTSMFLHGGWGHLLSNALFLWIFGNNVEDSMGRGRFVAFYLLCGLVAAAAQVAVHPESAVPMVGASGAISGVLGGYLLLYPRVPVHMLVIIVFFPYVFTVPAWMMLIWWFGTQLLLGLPQVLSGRGDPSGGVAFWAHIGGFLAGLVAIRLFARQDWVARRSAGPRRARRAW